MESLNSKISGLSSMISWPSSNRSNQEQSKPISRNEEQSRSIIRFFKVLAGQTLGVHKDLLKQMPDLLEVNTEVECDIILVFCPLVQTHAVDIPAALKKLNRISDTKPAVVVVLHHTFDSESDVGDSSRSVSRANTLTVDCLFYEDKGLLQCSKNDESLAGIINFIEMQRKHESPNQNQTKKKQVVPGIQVSQSKPLLYLKVRRMEPLRKAQDKETLKCFILLAGPTLNTHESFMHQLTHKVPQLQEVNRVEKCDVILAFIPVVSRIGTDIETALKKLNQLSAVKPAVVIVLHYTFKKELVVPDSSRNIKREKTITVDCLVYENKGFLKCRKNDEAFSRIVNYIKLQIKQIMPVENAMDTDQPSINPYMETPKYFVLPTEATQNAHMEFVGHLKYQIPELQKVEDMEECDLILVFCTDVSQAEHAIETARKKHHLSSIKPAVLVVLHHTLNPECDVPDSSRAVKREKTIAVDCLFDESIGLLQCQKNLDAFKRLKNFQKLLIEQIRPVEDKVDTEPMQSNKETLKYFVLPTGLTQNTHTKFMGRLKYQTPELQRVEDVEECDFILVFCTDVSQAEHAIETARKKRHLSNVKPAVLVVLHHRFDLDCNVPTSSKAVNTEETIRVDCLFLENLNLPRCQINLQLYARVKSCIIPVIDSLLPIEDKKDAVPTTKKTQKYFIFQSERSRKEFTDNLKNFNLKEVETEDECDLCMTVSSAQKNGKEEETKQEDAKEKQKNIGKTTHDWTEC